MQHRTARALLLATAGVGLVLAQQACANGHADAATAPQATATAAPTESSEPVPTATGSTAPGRSHAGTGKASGAGTTSGARLVCRSADIKAEVTFQPQRVEGNTRVGLVALTNASKRACTLGGRAAISLTNAAGDVVDVRTRNVNEPGPAATITLKPGRTAFQGIKWTVCDKSDATCGVGNGLVFNLEASTDGPAATLIGFPAAEKSNITMKSLSVGTLQPNTQGVVAW